MKKRMILLFIASLLVSACEEVDTRTYDEFSFNMTMTYYSEASRSKDIEYHYTDRHFYKDSSVYNKDLAVLSLGLASYVTYLDETNDAFTKMKFDHIYNGDYSFDSDDPGHIAYSIAYKVMNDVDGLISIAIRGFDYGTEWSSNFQIGENGNHYGFDKASDNLIKGLDKYILENSELANKNIKLWIYGFSRAGAVASLASSKLIDRMDSNKSPFVLTKENIYCYTFEAPNNIDASNKKSYPNIHNIINPNDLIPILPPEKFGFKRAGVTHLLDVSDIGADMKNFDSGVEYQEFKEKQLSLSLKNLGFVDVKGSEHNHEKFNQDFIDMLSAPSEDEKYHDISTRKNFCDNFEFGISYFISLFFQKGSYTGGEMIVDFVNDNALDLVLSLITGRVSGLYNSFKALFNEYEIIYEIESLVYACSQLEALLTYIIHDVDALYDEKAIIFATLAYNADLIAQMHSPEFIMALLDK